MPSWTLVVGLYPPTSWMTRRGLPELEQALAPSSLAASLAASSQAVAAAGQLQQKALAHGGHGGHEDEQGVLQLGDHQTVVNGNQAVSSRMMRDRGC